MMILTGSGVIQYFLILFKVQRSAAHLSRSEDMIMNGEVLNGKEKSQWEGNIHNFFLVIKVDWLISGESCPITTSNELSGRRHYH